jgi:hypothetical protein
VSALRIFLLAAACGALAACAANRDAPPEPAPTASAPLPVKHGPSSDHVWLVEMLTQRLELSALLAWAAFDGTDRDEELSRARFLALTEQAGRAGLPPAAAAAFFAQQNDAAETWQKILFRRWADPKRRPAAPPPSVETLCSQVDAVDLQIIATLLRLGHFPKGKEFRVFAIERFKERGIPRAVARCAASF